MPPSPTFNVRVHRAITELAPEAWNALLDPASAPFLEWAFLAALEESGSACAETGWHPRHFSLWRGTTLVAAAPAYLREDSRGEFVFDGAWASAAERVGHPYYPKLVVAVPFTPATGRRCLVAPSESRPELETLLYRAIVDFAQSEGLSGVHVLFPTEAEARALEERGFALRNGVQYHWHNAAYSNTEEYLARFSAKRRHQLKREMREPAKQGLTLRTLRQESLAQLQAEELYRLYISTVDKHFWGQRFLQPAFFERLLKTFSHRLEVVEARTSEGKLIAGAINLAGDEVLYGRYWGCFEERPFLHFNVCLYHSVEESIARGLKRFEPGAGGEHKLTRGFEPSLTFSAHLLFHPGLDRAVRGFLKHERAAVQAALPQWQAETGLKTGPS